MPPPPALGRFGAAAKPAEGTLFELLKDPNGVVRMVAAESLWHIDRHPAAIRAIIDELSRDTPPVPAAQAALPPGWTQPAPEVENPESADVSPAPEYAVYAIVHMGPEATQAVSALRVVSKQTERRVHIQAAVGLGKIDPKDDPLPTLLAALKSKQYVIRDDAAGALLEIRPPAKAVTPALLDAMKICAAEARTIPKKSMGFPAWPRDWNTANGYHSLCLAWFAELNVLRQIDPKAAEKYEATKDRKELEEYNRPVLLHGATGGVVLPPPQEDSENHKQ